MSSTDTAEKLLTKLSGFLISWAMPAVSWPSEASFSRLDEAILRGPQVLQRLRQFARASLHALEQARILDRHHRLVCKGLQQVDGGICELARRLAPDHQRADDVVGAEQRNDQDATIALAHDDLVDRRDGLVANVGDLDWLALRCRRPNIASPRPMCWSVIAAIIVSLMP